MVNIGKEGGKKDVMEDTYSQSLWIDAILNHGDTDRKSAPVQVTVLFGMGLVSAAVGVLYLSRDITVKTHQNGGNLMQNIDCLLSGSLFLCPLAGRHFRQACEVCYSKLVWK
jgi:hypothetical protein